MESLNYRLLKMKLQQTFGFNHVLHELLTGKFSLLIFDCNLVI